jgi:DHA3 family tetracycline resistance protein-like MFS transporter
MLHSHEALDRPGGASRTGLLAPLRDPNFRKLWGAMCVSLLGDGAFLVALAWQVYALTDQPAAMSLVGIAMTVPTIVFLLIGGVASDRFDRRRLMVAADLGRALAAGLLGILALTGALELWHIVLLAVVYGTAAAFFAPAFDAIVPELLPSDRLAQANALDQLARPLVLRMAGPALGGVLIAVAGSGAVFLLDGASFLVSAGALLMLRMPPRAAPVEGGSATRDLLEGWRYVRRRAWLWATFASAAIAYLCFMGPVEVLVPLLVKHELGGSAADLGLVFAAGGLGSVGCAIVMGRRGLPRRFITFMYVVWTAATLAVAGYGLSTTLWQLMAASLAFNALETAGTIVWATVKQRYVPGRMLGRVSSLDWLISIGLLPLSFALTGPVAAAIGARGTLVAGGLIGATATLAALCVPRMRELEQREAEHARTAGDPAPVPAAS